MVDSEDRYSTEKASSVQSSILYDCDAEALSNSIRPSQSYSPTIKWRCCTRLVQFHGFRSVEVLLDTPPGSPKNCPEARGGSVRVQITLSRPVNFFMVKPRLCPRQDQSIPVQSRRPLGFGQVLSDQPAASRLEHLQVPVIFKDSFIAGGWTIWITGDRILPIERRNTKSPGPRFPLLEARSWQEAKSNLVTDRNQANGPRSSRWIVAWVQNVVSTVQQDECLQKLESMVDSEDRYSTEKASSVQSSILYDCDAEALSNSIRPSQSYSPTIKWRCCTRLVQFHGFRSVEVLLDTPPGSPKNCPEARGGSVRVQITLSRPVNFFMVKPRLCPRQDQSIPVQSRRPLGFGQVLSDQPAASRLEHCELVPVIFKDSFIAGGWTIWITLLVLRVLGHIGRTTGTMVLTLSPKFPLLEARSWQEAKSNLVTVALGKDDRIAWCWTLGPPV
ncbi:hypothetical protein IGI04_039997 [Brassica rapa subsp. trilocularis]|uniref:Uncharacterized protein n=1 Tax=Brassica rapa subsp. trilocularis TaxID=1813537 RepID=A0ABQ7KPI9_BRACM|nr:hypothetical protein IGI04_039997 [Brassica rapa subsp. trilocularis]